MAAYSSASNKARFVNENMLVCKAKFNTYEAIAAALHREGYWKAVSGFQKLDYSHHYGVEIKDQELRERLFKNGLKVGYYNLCFVYHGTKNVRVYLSHLPLGVNVWDVKVSFASYGKVENVQEATKALHGRKVLTGERIISFLKLWKDIPSFIFLQGWQVAVKYSGQPKTCRIFYEQGHFADGYPKRKRNRESSDEESEEEMNVADTEDTAEPGFSDSKNIKKSEEKMNVADTEDTAEKPGDSAVEGFVQGFLETLDGSVTKREAGPENAPGSSDSKDVKKKPNIPQQPKDSFPVVGDQSAHVEQTVERTSVGEVKDKSLGAGSLHGDHGITKKKKKKKSSSSKAWMETTTSPGSWKF